MNNLSITLSDGKKYYADSGDLVSALTWTPGEKVEVIPLKESAGMFNLLIKRPNVESCDGVRACEYPSKAMMRARLAEQKTKLGAPEKKPS